MIWMTLSWIIGLALFVGLLWLLLAALRRPVSADDSPESLLRRRYAAGEIDTQEFQTRLSELRKSRGTA